MLIDFPMDLLKREFDYPDEEEELNIRGYRLLGKANEAQIKRLPKQCTNPKSRLFLPAAELFFPDAVDELRELYRKNRYSSCHHYDGE